jgi:hypothetical protein
MADNVLPGTKQVLKTSNNNYIYEAKDKTSYGYFADGNLVLKNDEATDTVTSRLIL